MGGGKVVIAVTLSDGSVERGEYVGAQEGWVYLATESGGVTRVAQHMIVRTSNVEALDE